MKNLKQILLGDILPFVAKPGRYLGNEWNSVHKDWESVELRVALAFPDAYEIGMSHLGMQILYGLLNSREDVLVERVFAPWVDMEKIMRDREVPLFSLESSRPVRDFDVLGFSLMYELCYTNVLNMLELSGIPFLSRERGLEYPLVIGGGTCASNPEPVAPFFDFFVLGDGEEAILEIVETLKALKSTSLWKPHSQDAKKDVLREFAKIAGVYVPSFYDVVYSNGTIKEIIPKENAPSAVDRRVVMDLQNCFFPTSFIVPSTEIVHDRISLELYRGCPKQCRFCEAGVLYRPVRMRTPEKLIELAKNAVRNTGWEEISLLSLSTSDYPYLEPLLDGLVQEFRGKGVKFSLPSLRPGTYTYNLSSKISSFGKSGLTLVAEAGTQRMRNVIRKDVTDESICNAVDIATSCGWQAFKFYFMMGLPTETDEDILGIARTVNMVQDFVKQKKRALKRVVANVSTLVPKPNTPFQWEPQQSLDETLRKQSILRQRIHGKRFQLRLHDPAMTFLEGVFARGDRRLSETIVEAQNLGLRFSAWADMVRMEIWEMAFKRTGVDPAFYHRARNEDEVLPWNHLEIRLTKDFLKREAYRAHQLVQREN